jgi:hypothetical protein
MGMRLKGGPDYIIGDPGVQKRENVREKGQALVAHTCNPSYSGGKRSGESQFKAIQGK